MSLRRVAIVPAALWKLLAVGLLVCFGIAHGAAQTTITGTVYAPNGTDPLPNILVYVAAPGVAVQPFTSGPGSDCANQNAIVSGNPIAEAVSDSKGNFTLQSVLLTALGSASVNIVAQAGKWRQQYPGTPITGGQANGPLTLTMPAAAGPNADLPQIAVVTGSADAVECVLLTMGIHPSEFTDVGGSGHINLFTSDGAAQTNSTQGSGGGAKISSTSAYTEANLLSNQTPMSNYDMLMFGCTGNYLDSDSNNTAYQQNLASYANSGGRVFATHYGYVWLNKQNTFATAANWRIDESSLQPEGDSDGPGTITVDTTSPTFPEGKVLADWLQYIGVSSTYGQIPNVPNLRQDQTGIASSTQSWGTLNPPYVPGDYVGTPIMQFSWDTPLGQATAPIVLLSFQNNATYPNTTSFVPGDANDSVTITMTDQAGSGASKPGLTLQLLVPSSLTVTGLAGLNPGTGWNCTLSTLTCVETASIQPGANDPVSLTFSVAANAALGTAQISGTLSNGGITGVGQCGRVLFNEYHVEPPASSLPQGNAHNAIFPNECSNTSSGAEKFLEFSLYNLSNFISPTTSDTIVIQAPSTTTITTNGQPGVQTPIYYGQIIGYTNGVNALVSTTAPGGTGDGTLSVSVDGVTVCTLQNGGSQVMCPNGGFEGQNAGNHTVQAFYSGDTDYLASQSPVYPETILPDPTATSLASSGSPSIYGNQVTFSTTVSNTAPFTDVSRPTPVGTVTFLDNGSPIGTGTLNSSGVATLTTSTLGVGTHTITASYGLTTNFTASVSVATTQVVTLPISATSTVLISSANPAYQGLNIMFSATVSQLAFTVAVPAGLSNPLPTGTVSFYDGTMLLGTSALNGAQTATLSISTLAVGTHNVTAVYSGDTANNTSTSAVLPEVVQPNTFTLTVNPTALNLIIGQAAPITVTITDNGNFNEPVQLACSGQSAETICTFGSVTVPAGGGVTTLTVIPQPPHNCVATASNEGPGTKWPMLAGVGVLLVAIRRRRKLLGLVSFGLLLVALPLLNGCGTAGCTDFGVYPGNYTFTVTATSAAPYAETQSQTMTMVVKP